MRLIVWINLAVAGGVTLPAAATTLPAANRDYSVIYERNPFGLRPPPPPVKKTVPTPPPEEVFLTGITSFGKERAYFMTKARPGQSPKYFDLGVGEASDGLEVLEIDPMAKSVRVRREGNVTLMTFQTNGIKPPALVTARAQSPNQPARQSSAARTLRPVVTRKVPSRIPRVSPNSAGLTGQSSAQTKIRPFAAEQDILLMELQRTANPHIVFPPTPMPPQ